MAANYLRPRRGKNENAITKLGITNPLRKGEVFFECENIGNARGNIMMGDGASPYSQLTYFLVNEDKAMSYSSASSIIGSSTTADSTLLGSIKSDNASGSFKNAINAIKQILWNHSTKISKLNTDLSNKVNIKRPIIEDYLMIDVDTADYNAHVDLKNASGRWGSIFANNGWTNSSNRFYLPGSDEAGYPLITSKPLESINIFNGTIFQSFSVPQNEPRSYTFTNILEANAIYLIIANVSPSDLTRQMEFAVELIDNTYHVIASGRSFREDNNWIINRVSSEDYKINLTGIVQTGSTKESISVRASSSYVGGTTAKVYLNIVRLK